MQNNLISELVNCSTDIPDEQEKQAAVPNEASPTGNDDAQKEKKELSLADLYESSVEKDLENRENWKNASKIRKEISKLKHERDYVNRCMCVYRRDFKLFSALANYGKTNDLLICGKKTAGSIPEVIHAATMLLVKELNQQADDDLIQTLIKYQEDATNEMKVFEEKIKCLERKL